MYTQQKLIDGIRSFSPTEENWVAKPAENLPEKVTVSFKTGQRGLLDMKSPRAVHWANIIEQLAKANQPVYVEIDEESKVITRLLIPQVFKVQGLKTDERGDVIVRLMPSSAIHFLLKSDPNFKSIQTTLQNALDNDSPLLITETRDEHEIIDARPPIEATSEPSHPMPAPPDDPPISEARAQELYGYMNAESCNPCSPSSDCIPFKYPDDGCWARAHKMCYMMVNDHNKWGQSKIKLSL